jgi:hypothetical protein
MYTAIYLPSRSDGQDITKSGFKTKEAAWRYAERWYCKGCRHKIALALTWKHRYGINSHEAGKAVYKALKELATKDLSYNQGYGLDFEMDGIFGDENGDACGCEWMVLETEKYEKCEDFGDIMDASGAKRIFTVGEKDE